MCYNTGMNQRNSIDDSDNKESRMSIESMTSLGSQTLFDGEELVGYFSEDPNAWSAMQNSNTSMDTSVRSSSLEEIQRLSMSFKRLSSISLGTDRRESWKSLLEEATFSDMDCSFSQRSAEKSNHDMNVVQEETIDDDKSIRDLRSYDIICGRNNGAHNWVGNRRFRITIMMNLQAYREATRGDKAKLITSVVNFLQSGDHEAPGARFVTSSGDGNTYTLLNDKQIREKVGHAFRDMISVAELQKAKHW